MNDSVGYREFLAPEARALALAIRAKRSPQDIAELRAHVEHLGLDNIRAAARRNQVESAVGTGLAEVAGISLSGEWATQVLQNEQRVQRMVRDLGELCASMDARGLACAAVEAGGVMLSSALPMSAYDPGDIDLLVVSDGFAHADEILSGLGYRSEKRAGRTETSRREYVREEDVSTLRIELVRVPFERAWIQLPYVNRTDEWLASRVLSTRAERIATLGPTQALVFVAFHTSLHSYVRAPGIRLHMDVDRLVADNEIDWSEFVREVEAVGIRTRVFVSLAMAAFLLGTSIPAKVLRDLSPSRERWWAIRHLLSGEGIDAGPGPKLPRSRAILLDMLISNGGAFGWLYNAALPDRAWLAQQFGEPGDSLVRMHIRRLRGLATRWRPR